MSGNGWTFSDQAIVAKLFNQDIEKALAKAATKAEQSGILLKRTLINGSRLLLLLVFGGICVLVYIAGNKRKNR